jgi:hypothetical protein
MGKQIKFTATILEAGVGTGGAYVLFPYDVEKTFGAKGRIPIISTIDGVPYRGSIVKYGHPQHIFPVLKGIREKIGKNIGDTIEVILQRDTGEREIETPSDLKNALKANKLDKAFDKLSYTHRKEYVQWIEGAKKEGTRENRIVKAVEMIKEKTAK